jgi:hypothetical protein
LYGYESTIRRIEELLDLKDFPALLDDFASWIGLTPDGGALLMRDRSLQEIYALDLRLRGCHEPVFLGPELVSLQLMERSVMAHVGVELSQPKVR